MKILETPDISAGVSLQFFLIFFRTYFSSQNTSGRLLLLLILFLLGFTCLYFTSFVKKWCLSRGTYLWCWFCQRKFCEQILVITYAIIILVSLHKKWSFPLWISSFFVQCVLQDLNHDIHRFYKQQILLFMQHSELVLPLTL